METNEEALNKLFGIDTKNQIEVNQIFLGTMCTYLKESSLNWKELLVKLKSITEADGTIHPFDNSYKQVPAKLLVNEDGRILIHIKSGIEIELLEMDGSSSGDTGRMIVNEFGKK